MEDKWQEYGSYVELDLAKEVEAELLEKGEVTKIVYSAYFKRWCIFVKK